MSNQIPDTPATSRRAILIAAPVAAAAVLAGGTIANALAIGAGSVDEADPIFGLIDKHKAACDIARSIGDAEGDLPCDDPNCEAGNTRFREAFKEAYKVLAALLTCQPTTIAGCVAMLDHVSQRDWIFGDDFPQTILTDAYESGVAEAQAFSKHLAAALRKIIERGQA